LTETGIVVDSSALIALLLGEPEHAAFVDTIFKANHRQISAFSILETGAVALSRRGSKGRVIFDSLCEELALDVVPLNSEHVRFARAAWDQFGKGRHSAGLNIGDCCSYALARATGYPLLYKGNDFPKTDLELVRF
jgi:ribonuclease VapC